MSVLMNASQSKRKSYPLLARWVQKGFYPLALVVTVIYVISEANGYFGKIGSGYGWYLGLLIAIMVSLERFIPMRDEWNMTCRLFFIRDLPLLLINGAAVFLTNKALVWLANITEGDLISQFNLTWWTQAIIALALADFAWYWVHSYCHEGKGIFGKWMWRTHVIHHLPEEVYVFMHVAGHPIQAAVVRITMMLPVILLGLSPEAVFIAATFNALQGLVSHFNVDSRAGFFNRLLMGTELHRYHHSADMKEAGNYAAFFSVFDWIFGTYRLPGVAPVKLGVSNRDKYPKNNDWLGLMKIPFKDISKK